MLYLRIIFSNVFIPKGLWVVFIKKNASSWRQDLTHHDETIKKIQKKTTALSETYSIMFFLMHSRRRRPHKTIIQEWLLKMIDINPWQHTNDNPYLFTKQG